MAETNTKLIAAIIFFAVLLTIYMTTALYCKKGWFKKWFHDVMGWHLPDNSESWSDGCSEHSKCRLCGKDIMQDSQGNWF